MGHMFKEIGKGRRPVSTLNEVVRKDMIDDRVTENMAVNRSEWKNRTHKINQNR